MAVVKNGFLSANSRFRGSLNPVWLSLLLCAGCFAPAKSTPPGGMPTVLAPPPNPILVPDQDPAFLWNQIVDTVDDYFRIEKEQPVQRYGSEWLEGRLQTYPEVGATCLEPWRSDAANSFERLLGTLQSVRRTCVVRAVPGQGGYQIEVLVSKQLEDVDRSQFSGEGAATQRHDGTVVRTNSDLRSLPITLGWIDMGRDFALEQKILTEIAGRVTNVTPPRQKLLAH
jgi:hypothetical protein